MRIAFVVLSLILGGLPVGGSAQGGVGDPQIATDHPWYPGELSCSTFVRLHATQAALYRRVTGREVKSDEDRALASWLWRNTHVWHGSEGAQNLWGEGFQRGGDLATRDYWTGLFSHGFALCGSTHAQWSAEMNVLLGHNRGRVAGVQGHNSFEVLLTGGPYRDGQWTLLDHDISTVVFNREGSALLPLAEVQKDYRRLTDRKFLPERQRGWLVCGLDASDGAAYSRFTTAEYLAGYAGPPPLVHLRRGETLRRYFEPGGADGRTFVFWGINDNQGGVPGPARAQTWVNQPEQMFGSRDGTRFQPGQARYANAVYTYTPDFASGDYREGVVAETAAHVDFEFNTPFIIAATPANDAPWGIYDPGCRNGLTVRGDATCGVSVSVDRGHTWQAGGQVADGPDLTDHVKGHRQYWLRLAAGAAELAKSKLAITTICQVNSSVLPRLRDDGTDVRFQASQRAIVSAGPTRPQAQAHVIEGKFGSPRVTLELATPRGELLRAIYAAAHVNSSNPPDPEIAYQIEYSTNAGQSWASVVRDWRITRRGHEPADFWSQSFCYGHADLPASNSPEAAVKKVQVRFRNSGGKAYARAELHATYEVPAKDATQVTFAWSEAGGAKQATHTFDANTKEGDAWHIATGQQVRTRWVEFAPVASAAR